MKNKNTLKRIGIFVIGFTMLVGCSSDDSNNTDTPESSSLFDKWWYDSNNVTADIYFHSDGRYEQKITILGEEFTGTADWSWENEASGIMKIDNIEGAGQLFSSTLFKLYDITDNTFTLQQSTNGTDYSIEVFYQDTDN